MKLYRNAQVGSLKFGHLDWKGMSPAKAYMRRMGKVFNKRFILNRVSMPPLLRFEFS
jgi:hypothetical protein